MIDEVKRFVFFNIDTKTAVREIHIWCVQQVYTGVKEKPSLSFTSGCSSGGVAT